MGGIAMAITLDEVVKEYLKDTEYQKVRHELEQKRDSSISSLQNVITRFVRGLIDLHQFFSLLQKTLNDGEDWGATGFGFMMELNKFAKYHCDNTSAPAARLREILTGLNAQNLGQRIDTFYTFLLGERERLRKEGKTSGMIVAASRSAFILSLFAYWLDPGGQPIIYYDSLRRGLFTLVKAELLPASEGVRMGPHAIEVQTVADHLACVQLINYLATHASQVKLSVYWTESFCLWVTQRFQSLNEPANVLIKESDATDQLTKAPSQIPVVHDATPAYTVARSSQMASNPFDSDAPLLIAPGPLPVVREPLLTERIREVQRAILVEESVVQHIYHALLNGHVILTGPPGTGKTELARIIPEILWRSDTQPGEDASSQAEKVTAYTTRIVTATDEWSVRTLIGGIAPRTKNGNVTYGIQHGFLTTTIFNNWSFDPDKPEEWNTLRRKLVIASSGIERGKQQIFRGQWLVIDEFNRAPIDLALGDALTALGGNEVLRIPIEEGSAELPVPADFRVIGTLNSFDRNYLNQISEALKRRFSFIEILPPGRHQRTAEQAIVLYKALKKIAYLSEAISAEGNTLYWQDFGIEPEDAGLYSITWIEEHTPFPEVFETAWRILEVIRIYRQLGTAQAITLVRHMLIAGILQGYNTSETWIEKALDEALCDTIADQLQVLLPDEIETLLLRFSLEPAAFSKAYNDLLGRLTSSPQRLYGQLIALGSIRDEEGRPFLSDAEIEEIASQPQPAIPGEQLTALFHLNFSMGNLGQFRRRLRAFKMERGL
jgi:hypothetical protein